MPTVLVTGAARGLGLEFVRQYAADGWTVLAGCRNPQGAEALSAIGGDVHAYPLDVTSDESCAALAGMLAGRPIDLLVNNAGMARRGPRRTNVGLAETDTAEFAEILQINTIGPFRVTRALLPCLRAGKGRMVATVSSRMGSIALNVGGSSYAYRASKAAVNAVNKCFAIELAPEGFTCVVLHPGWVRTDMGSAEADIDADESVRGMRSVLARLTPADSGNFYNYDGAPLPW